MIAQDWAVRLAQGHFFEHRPSNVYGENLWMASGISEADVMNRPGINPVDDWYNEIQYYPSGAFKTWGKLVIIAEVV